jgi:2-keto-4-pentenoate hydratase
VAAVDIQELARRMLADYDARTPGRRAREPLNPGISEAYAVQSEIARLREQRGETIIGYKVGCTSRLIQAQLGVSEPIFGRLFAEEYHPSGKRLSAACFANLAVEGELAVQLRGELSGPSVTEEDCRAAIASTFGVIELHHYVLPATWPRIHWLIASSGLHAGFVLPPANASGNGSAQSLTVRVNDHVVGEARDAEALVSPVRSLCWLAGRLAEFGLRLHPGQVILTGSPLPLFPIEAGSRVVVEAPPHESCCVEIDP